MEKKLTHIGQTTASRRTYVLLQKTFLKLLGEIPFEKITLTELCDAAMVPRSTFYRYFEDKYDFLRFCLRNFLLESGFEETSICLDDDETFSRLLLTVLTYLEKSKESYRKICDVNDMDGGFWKAIQEYLSDVLAAGLQKAEENGKRLVMEKSVLITLTTDFYLSAFRCYMALPESYSALRYASDLSHFIGRNFFA